MEIEARSNEEAIRMIEAWLRETRLDYPSHRIVIPLTLYRNRDRQQNQQVLFKEFLRHRFPLSRRLCSKSITGYKLPS